VVNDGTVSTNGDSGTGILTDTGNNTVTHNGTVSATGLGGIAILTGPGNDTVTIGASATVNGVIDGGTDTDTLVFAAFTQSQLAGLNPAAGTFGGYSWVNFEQLTGLLYEPVANVEVTIGGNPMGSYDVPSGSRISPIYPGINNGPVQVHSTNGADIIVSERAYRGLNYTDWNEMLGFPADQLTTEYWFPLCDGTGSAQTFISIGNASQT